MVQVYNVLVRINVKLATTKDKPVYVCCITSMKSLIEIIMLVIISHVKLNSYFIPLVSRRYASLHNIMLKTFSLVVTVLMLPLFLLLLSRSYLKTFQCCLDVSLFSNICSSIYPFPNCSL